MTFENLDIVAQQSLEGKVIGVLYPLFYQSLQPVSQTYARQNSEYQLFFKLEISKMGKSYFDLFCQSVREVRRWTDSGGINSL